MTDGLEAAREKDIAVAAWMYACDHMPVHVCFFEEIMDKAFRAGVEWAEARTSESALRAAALRMRDRPHVVQVSEDGWGIQHPLTCRPALIECGVHQAVMQWIGPPVPPGEYEISPLGQIVGPYDEPDPVLVFLAALDGASYSPDMALRTAAREALD